VRLIFESHATSLDNEANLASGHFDVDLSPLGLKQAGQLGERYRDHDLTAIYCSDLRRAYRTAEIAFPKASVIRDARLRECDYGRLTRHPVKEVEEWKLRCIDSPFPGGESYRQAAQRVASLLAELPADGEFLLIGHRAVYYALEHLLRGAELRAIVAAPWHWQPGWVFEVPGQD